MNGNRAKIALISAIPIGALAAWQGYRRSHSAVAVAKAHHEALISHQWEILKALYSPSVYYVDPDVSMADRDEVVARAEALEAAFSDVRFDGMTSAGERGTAITEWTYCGRHTGPLPMPDGSIAQPTGAYVNLSGLSIFEVRDGLIATERSFWDNETLHRQLGLPAGAAESREPSPRERRRRVRIAS